MKQIFSSVKKYADFENASRFYWKNFPVKQRRFELLQNCIKIIYLHFLNREMIRIQQIRYHQIKNILLHTTDVFSARFNQCGNAHAAWFCPTALILVCLLCGQKNSISRQKLTLKPWFYGSRVDKNRKLCLETSSSTGNRFFNFLPELPQFLVFGFGSNKKWLKIYLFRSNFFSCDALDFATSENNCFNS